MRVDRQRTTLVLEGAMNENGPWKELSFHHVPSALEKMPSIIRTSCFFARETSTLSIAFKVIDRKRIFTKFLVRALEKRVEI